MIEEIIENFRVCGFVVKKISGTEIGIYLNEKLAGIFEKLGYDCNIGMLKRSTIFNMGKENCLRAGHCAHPCHSMPC